MGSSFRGSTDAEVRELHFLMNGLKIERLVNGPAEGLQSTTQFIFNGEEVICLTDELLPKLREIAQLKLLKDKEKAEAANSMTFGDAIAELKGNKKVARKGWNGKGMYLELQTPDTHSKMSLPYIYMKTADDKLVPWLASQTDMLSDDWEIV